MWCGKNAAHGRWCCRRVQLRTQAGIYKRKATMKDNDPTPALPLLHKPLRWRLFFVLWTASVVGMFLVLPYALTMIPANLSSKLPPLHILILLQAGQGTVFLGLLTLAGLFFSNRTGLAAPILE